jgi:hypothetical protein
VNFIKKSQMIAAAERIVLRDFGCDGMPPKLTRGMHRSFRMVLEAGGNEYDAAVGFVLGMTLEQLEWGQACSCPMRRSTASAASLIWRSAFCSRRCF